MLMATERLAQLYVGWRPPSQAQVQSLQYSQSQLQNLKPSQHASHSLQAEVFVQPLGTMQQVIVAGGPLSMSYASYAQAACPKLDHRAFSSSMVRPCYFLPC